METENKVLDMVKVEKPINNDVVLEGYVDTKPEMHHTTHGDNIYKFTIRVPRLNTENCDRIPVEISDRVTDISKLEVGSVVRLQGSFRSFNRKDFATGKFTLHLYVFVKELEHIESTIGVNKIHLEGNICKESRYRVTPTGREIADMLVASNRFYGKSDYLPVVSWGRNAKFASKLNVGDKVSIEGRVQSRIYKKHSPDGTDVEKTAYEVSVISIVKSDKEKSKSDN